MKNFHFLTVLAILLFSCQESPLIPNSSDMERTLVLDFKTAEFEDGITTRSFDEINDLDIFIFDNDGNKIHHRHIDNYDNTSAHFILPRTPYSIAVIANTNNEFSDISTLEEAKAITVDTDNEALSYFEENLSADAPDNASGSVTHKTIELKRTFAKVTVAFNFSNLNSGIRITPEKITVKTTPKECTLLTDNSIQKGSNFDASGDIIQKPYAYATHNNARPLYALENLQGTFGSIDTPQQDKTPDNAHAGLCTYLEIEATYENSEGSRPITYRYYLGENTTNDFNVKRNCWYKVSIDFKGDGGYDENSWRVTTEELNNIIIYVPYVGCRTYYIPVGSIYSANTSHSTTWRADPPNSYLFLEEDYTNTANELLAFIRTKGKEITISRLPRNKSTIIPETSVLYFPKNSTFGHTSYPVTKHINFLRDEALPCDNTVCCEEDWVYFGDGDTFKSFESSGTASTHSTSDMYNKTSRKVSLSNFPSGNIAIRCAENTTLTERTATIKFVNSLNTVIAIVTIRQNPGNYPASPCHLSYILGGKYNPGAYTASKKLESSSYRYQYLPTNYFYEWESPFYVSTTEITNLEFCDFLNDLSITSCSQLNSKSFAALGKCGTVSNDYLGILPPNKQTASFSTDQNSNIEYSLSLWQPQKVNALRQNNSIYSQSIRAHNYPSDNVSLFTAADYNYWAADRASRPMRRTSDPLLITELEWEAAARGISNANDPKYNDNGLYPYPLFDHTDSKDLYSNMGGNTSDAKIREFTWLCNELKNGAIKNSIGVLKYPVGILSPNRADVFDLGGNVREWCFDVATLGNEYQFSTSSSDAWYRGTPGSIEELYGYRSFRGGCTEEPTFTSCVAFRNCTDPNSTNETIGIRLVIR